MDTQQGPSSYPPAGMLGWCASEAQTLGGEEGGGTTTSFNLLQEGRYLETVQGPGQHLHHPQ